MLFSSDRQPRYAVYIVRPDGSHVQTGRYGSLFSALYQRDLLIEWGEAAYLDVKH